MNCQVAYWQRSGQTHYNPFTSKTKRAQVKESQQKRKNESAYGKARLVRTLRGLELGLASLALSECSFSRLLFLRYLIFRFAAQCNSSTHTLFVCMANAFVCARHVYRLEEGRKFSTKAIVKAGQQDRFERGERKRVQYLLRSTAWLA